MKWFVGDQLLTMKKAKIHVNYDGKVSQSYSVIIKASYLNC